MLPSNTIEIPVGMRRLVTSIQEVVDRGLPDDRTAPLVAELLRAALPEGELLRERDRTGSPDGYTQHVLHVGDGGGFSVVALVWLPGQCTPVHDHLSWCVVGVLEGEETEVVFAPDADGPPGSLRVVGEQHNPTGSVGWLVPPDDIHVVRNDGPGLAISLHVYGADVSRLGSSIRRTYRPAGS
ncbi:cysteine dioxygenase [Kitasatospora sp. NPDC015120]|uniref:cysteine dioxygenase family protein n=1 Tax=Kitasatospora sp. NPDC015120 TaxID=3364023 RepID=UPI0036F49502